MRNKTNIFYIFFIYFVIQINNAYGVFQGEVFKNRPYFIEDKKGTWYVGSSVGFTAHIWGSNIKTMNLSNIDTLSDKYTDSFSTGNTWYVDAFFGYQPASYKSLRHEFAVSYISIQGNSKDVSLTSGTATVDYFLYNGEKISGFGSYLSSVITMTYRLYYCFDSIVLYPDSTLLGSPIIPFVFSGIGLAIMKGGLYKSSEYITTSGTTADTFYDISSVSDAEGKSFIKFDYNVGIAFEVGAGFVYDISSNLAIQSRIKYALISKPLFDNSLSVVTLDNDASQIMMHYIGFDIGVMFSP